MKKDEIDKLNDKREDVNKKYIELADQYFYADFSCNSRRDRVMSDWKILDTIVNLREENERLDREFDQAMVAYYEL
ncbi:MAG: hypothetical protein HY001_03445 [Candidatus Portnoybacteria bacterium]|nr:hypothetical protein [Candidatus Portnoybacteria bacterium]